MRDGPRRERGNGCASLRHERESAGSGTWPYGGGEMGGCIRAHAWDATPLGPLAGWPRDLRTTLQLVLAMRQPAGLCWGKEAALLYNDAYRAILGDKHPGALGAPLVRVWPELADFLRPAVEATLAGTSQLWDDTPFDLWSRGDGPRTGWFTASWTPVRLESGEVGGFLMVAVETTARRLAERALRRSEERQAFLLTLSDALRDLDDPVAVQQAAQRALGEHLGADRVAYAEDVGDGAHVDLKQDWTRGGPSIAGRYRYADYGRELMEALRAGRPCVRPDIQADPLMTPAEKAAHATLGVGATLCVPLVKQGRLVAILTVHYAGPHDFRPDEVAITEETAERTWAAVERARAEAALRGSEERFRHFANASSDILWIRSADTLALEFLSPAFEPIYGLPREAVAGDPRRWGALIVPDDREAALRRLDEVRQGRSVTHEFRIRRPADGAFRWIRSTDFPLFGPEERVQRLAGIASDVTEAKQSAEHQAVLLAELQHRVRNIMAMIRSVTARTADTAMHVRDYAELLSGRLMALARTQALLTRAANLGVEVDALVRAELEAQAQDPGQYDLSGPPVTLAPKAAEVLSLAVHELATNALKHGALAGSRGRVVARWRLTRPDGRPWLRLAWSETRPPEPDWAPPAHRGFGTSLIEQRVPYELGGRGRLAVTREGAEASIEFPLGPAPSILETDAPVRTGVSGGALDMIGEPSLVGQRVLVAEDDFFLASDAEAALQAAGAVVVGPFPREEAALAALRAGGVTAAVVDINLGAGPSFETARALFQAGTPFIFLTGYDQAVIPAEFGDVVRLQKPIEPRHIVRAIARLVEGRRG